ncbi:MAG: hypothetical protein P8Y29_00395 [Gemmatimonadota bacterium]|jgi:hypothetical protein
MTTTRAADDSAGMVYHHTQTGWVIIGSVIVGLVVTLWWLLAVSEHWGPDIVVAATLTALFLFLLFVFRAMTIEVDSAELRWWFGGRFWTHNVAIDKILAVVIVRTRFWHGWGIHRVSGGWLYNVSGRSVVEVHLRGGKLLRLGTDEPERLLCVLRLVARI